MWKERTDHHMHHQAWRLPRDHEDAPLTETHLQNTNVPAFAVTWSLPSIMALHGKYLA